MMEYSKPSPTISKYVLEALEEEERRSKGPVIDLYPYIQENEYSFLEEYYEREREAKSNKEYGLKFLNYLDEELLFHCLYTGLLEPVLENMYCTSHQKKLAEKTVRNYINENGSYTIIENFRMKGRYLQELATISDFYRRKILNETKEKICKGMTEKDACEIEDGNINGIVCDVKEVIPKDILKSISNKVEDAITDFIDDNKKSKYLIKKVYDDAKAKLIKSTEEYPEDAVELQQEAMAFAKAREREILETTNYNLFRAMSEVLMESVYKINVLKESYTKENGKIDFKKVLDDTTVLYSFLECLNTMNIENITEDYLNNMLKDMQRSISETSSTINAVNSVGTIDTSELNKTKKDNEEEDDIENSSIPQSVASKRSIM